MSLPTKTRQWVLINKPTALPVLEGDEATFALDTKEIQALQDGEVLLQTLYLSNDPAQRSWISANADPERYYVLPVQNGEIMLARGICKVLDSKDTNIPKNSFVLATCGWTEYRILPAAKCQLISEIPSLSITHFLGALGTTGLTAYYGLVEIIRAKAGESVVVSGAAGATGSMVIQIAKHIVGCSKVIGLAGTDEKCRWVESLGADACINYKDTDWKDQLTKATSGFVDVYFDNVGGEQLDFMLGRMKTHGRIAACGAISVYNQQNIVGIKNWTQIILQRLEVRGFIVTDFIPRANEAIKTLIEAMKSGKIRLGDENETVVETAFESIPNTWLMLFSGQNRGKLVTKLV